MISRGWRPEARNAGYLLLLSKTSLQALEPKYNSKTEFGIKKSSSFIAFQGKAAAAAPPPSKRASLPGRRAVGAYREIEDLAGLDQSCVLATSLLGHVFKVVPGS